MALTTYSELQGAIADWMARSDISGPRINDCIAMFEAAANRRLRVRQMQTAEGIATVDGIGALPTGYLTWTEVAWLADPVRVLAYADANWADTAIGSVAGTPSYFYIQGESIYIYPQDDSSEISLAYYTKIPALADSAPTNWLLSAHPDVYLFGSLVEACGYTMDEKGIIWKARRDEIFLEIERLSEKSKAPSIPRLMTRVP